MIQVPPFFLILGKDGVIEYLKNVKNIENR